MLGLIKNGRLNQSGSLMKTEERNQEAGIIKTGGLAKTRELT